MEISDLAWRKPRALVWSQAQREGPSASAWWPGSPQSPARHSLNKLNDLLSIPQAHYLREAQLGLGALPERWQWRRRVSTQWTLDGRGWLIGGGREGTKTCAGGATSVIWWGLPPRRTSALEPNFGMWVGLCSSPELPKVWGVGQVWGCSQAPGWAQLCWSLPRCTRGLPPYALGLWGENSDLLIVLMHWTAVQSILPSWRPWMELCMGLLLGTPLLYSMWTITRVVFSCWTSVPVTNCPQRTPCLSIRLLISGPGIRAP